MMVMMMTLIILRQVARLTHLISILAEGISMMKTTLVGIIKVGYCVIVSYFLVEKSGMLHVHCIEMQT